MNQMSSKPLFALAAALLLTFHLIGIASAKCGGGKTAGGSCNPSGPSNPCVTGGTWNSDCSTCNPTNASNTTACTTKGGGVCGSGLCDGAGGCVVNTNGNNCTS